MNKKSIFYITLILIFALSSLGFSNKNNTIYKDSDINKYLEEQQIEMNIMMKEMKDIKPSGDSAKDFLNAMIPHHKAAVEMSKSLLKYGGQNNTIKKIAEDTINNQSKEIEQMKDMIKNIDAGTEKDEKNEQGYLEEYNNMHNDNMHDNNKSHSDSVDKAYAIEMIKHHKMAIDMSNVVLKYTDNKEVIDMANNIIETQKGEIKQMEDFINK